MDKILVVLGHGFEETEYVATRDALIRCGFEVESVSLEGTLEIKTNHNLVIKADKTFNEVVTKDYKAIFIPGGPGTNKLGDKKEFDLLLKDFVNSDRVIAAICAAPILLAKRGLLKDHYAVCHPDEELVYQLIIGGAKYLKEKNFVKSGRFFTGKNMRVSIEFGYELAKFIENKK